MTADQIATHQASAVSTKTLLLESLKIATQFIITERDCFYEGCSTPDGMVNLAEDKQELGRLDALIDRFQAVIKQAENEHAEED